MASNQLRTFEIRWDCERDGRRRKSFGRRCIHLILVGPRSLQLPHKSCRLSSGRESDGDTFTIRTRRHRQMASDLRSTKFSSLSRRRELRQALGTNDQRSNSESRAERLQVACAGKTLGDGIGTRLAVTEQFRFILTIQSSICYSLHLHSGFS